MTKSPSGKCHQHVSSGSSPATTPNRTSIPHVGSDQSATIQSGAGTFTSWSDLVPSFLKKNYKGESALARLVSGGNREERAADKMRGRIFATIPNDSGRDYKPLIETLENVTDQKKLEGLLSVAQQLSESSMEDFPREGFLALINADDGAVKDVQANLNHITERYDNLNRIVGIRGDLIEKFGVTPNEEGLIPTLQAHNEVRTYLLEHPFYGKKFHYLGTPAVVRAVESDPEQADRVIEYFRERQQKPTGDERMYTLKFTFDEQNFNDYMSTTAALSDGVL